jgi:hypothetical protein
MQFSDCALAAMRSFLATRENQSTSPTPMAEPNSPPPRKPPLHVSHDPVVGGVSLLMTGLTRTVKPIARAEGETMVVEYGRPFKWFAVIGEVFFLALLVEAALSHDEPDKRGTILTIFSIFVFLGLLLHLEFFHVSIRYDVHGLQTKSPWRRNRTIPWEDIAGITFENTPQWYAISTTRYGKVRVPFWLSGIDSLLAEVARRGFAIPAADIKWRAS